MRLKVCGLTNAENAREVAMLGVDAIGLVFYEKSPRNVSITTAQEIIKNLPPFINKVGLFVNAKQSFIDKVINNVAIDTLQFHGDETPKECEKYALPFIKAVRVDETINLYQISKNFNKACGLLLDAKHDTLYGGSGQSFDWSLIKEKIEIPIILAGGLNENNVKQAIAKVKPYGVDVSSGVEQSKGIKDIQQVKNFMEQIR
ncbi:Phosphoribosylanthranilate isomerase [hydrothermal vent metagenome]|uniref:phosphoribosylanthranilate isomerase n=1 Tax=hydrothermal vent metagenome TaxID=652676 RepID=A0A1W1CR79_9ZZZZ